MTGTNTLGRALLLGGSVGAVLVWAITTALALGQGAEPAAAVAFGAFVGIWGGAGLGSMVAATIPLSRLLPPDDQPSRTGSSR